MRSTTGLLSARAGKKTAQSRSLAPGSTLGRKKADGASKAARKRFLAKLPKEYRVAFHADKLELLLHALDFSEDGL